MVVRRSSAPRRSSRPSSSPGAGSLPSPNDAKVIVPQHNVDPIWSLRPWPAVLTIGGLEFEIPAMPAADWLAYLMQPEPDLEAILDDFAPEVQDLLFDEVVSLEEVFALLLDLVATVSARPWWITVRLIATARTSWQVLGPEMTKNGADAECHSLAMWLDILLVTILNSMEPKDTTMFTMKLEAPPTSEQDPEVDAMDSMEMDRGAFMAMGLN